jgi:hypothetical protein
MTVREGCSCSIRTVMIGLKLAYRPERALRSEGKALDSLIAGRAELMT